MKSFNLTFTEAMHTLFYNNSWIQGENFNPKCFLQNDNGVARIYTIHEKFVYGIDDDNVLLSLGLMNQKYRVITILNYKEVTMGRCEEN